MSSFLAPKLESIDSFSIMSAIFCTFVIDIDCIRFFSASSLFMASMFASCIPSLNNIIITLFSYK